VRKQVNVHMAVEVKQALFEYAFKERLSLNDAAVSILATKLGFALTPSGRARQKPPTATLTVVLRMPGELLARINETAHDAGINKTDFINKVLAEALEVAFTPAGRRRVPWGGGRRFPPEAV
jgi:hypothetical protein